MRKHKLSLQRYLRPISTALIGEIGANIGLDREVVINEVLVKSDGVGIGVTK